MVIVMTERPSKRLALRIFVLAVALIAMFVFGIVAYAYHVRRSADELIKSAYEVSSSADAERMIASWRKRSGPQFWEERSQFGGDRSYDAQIENILVSRLRIVEPTVVNLGVTMNDGKLCALALTVSSGRDPKNTSAIWIQEWFDSGSSKGIHVNDKDKPWKATVEFSSDVPEGRRQRAFAINTRCFLKIGGCKSAEEILPTVWQLASNGTI
jgi:hypothetical protein